MLRPALRFFSPVLLLLALLCGCSAGAQDRGTVAVVIGSNPPEIQKYAGAQLCSYLDKLFGIKAQPVSDVPASARTVFLVGSADTNGAIRDFLAGNAAAKKLSDQGMILRRGTLRGRPVLALVGGSPTASLWAVYELAERYWGVRYLLHGDVLPKPAAFRLPDADLTLEPISRVRQWRVLNEFACGPASWGLRDYRPVLDQLAKLKFNRIFIIIWPHQPFLDYEVNGIQRRSFSMFFGYHFPIVNDMIGRSLFGHSAEFWNPDLPVDGSYRETVEAGQRHVHSLIEYARRRGMESVIGITPTDFPPEFAPLLPGAEKVHQLGAAAIVPGAKTKLDDPGLTALASAVLRSAVNTYPELSGLEIELPEWRQWIGEYQHAWDALNAKYDINRARSLADVLGDAGRRTDYPGGSERAVNEVKGDIETLYFYDRLLNGLRVLDGTKRPDVKILYSTPARELFPILSRVLPRNWEMIGNWEYTASRILKHEEVFGQVPARQIPSVLIQTLHDDNVGLLPQLALGPIARLTRDLQRYGWIGFSTRYWLIGDHDATVSYLARASWDSRVTPDDIIRDQTRAICGPQCVAPMQAALAEVERVTASFEMNDLGIAFPVPGMMMKHWKAGTPSVALLEDCSGYRRARELVRTAQQNSSGSDASRQYLAYWAGRLDFGIGYLEAVFAVRKAATAEAAGDRAGARTEAERALSLLSAAIRSYVAVAADQSDRGAIATLNEYTYFPLKAKVAELQKAAAHP